MWVEVPEAGRSAEANPQVELIEQFFFAYRDFVAEVDRILADRGLGRAHHRVLHFVARRPGLAVADLLDILRVTKQSLNRVVRDLVAQGLVEQRTGLADRRQRPLFPTPEGHAFACRLASVQGRRIAGALPKSPAGREAVRRFLLALTEGAGEADVHPVAEAANLDA